MPREDMGERVSRQGPVSDVLTVRLEETQMSSHSADDRSVLETVRGGKAHSRSEHRSVGAEDEQGSEDQPTKKRKRKGKNAIDDIFSGLR